jgi:peptidyl-prolyl cis-trans isomerase C
MHMRQTFCRNLAVLIIGLVVTACGPGGEPERDVPTASSEAVATVDGTAITPDDLRLFMDHFSRRPRDPEGGLDELIELHVLAREAERRGLDRDEDVQRRLELARAGTLASALTDRIRTDHGITEEDIRREYEALVEADTRTEYRARHILVEDEAQARGLIERIGEGAAFAALAEEFSVDRVSNRAGGDLGWIDPDTLPANFVQAVRVLEPGQVTPEPVQTESGWHVILLEETHRKDPVPYENVRWQVKDVLVRRHVRAQIEALRAAAEITRTAGAVPDEVEE